MRKLLFLAVMIFSVFGMALAQDEDSTKSGRMFREIREYKMKYLAKEIDLSDTQKQQFFDLYSEMSTKLDGCYAEVRQQEQLLKKEGDNASDEDYERVTQSVNRANAEAAEIEKSYNDKFAEFLSPKQIYKLKEAERKFRRRLEEMRHERKKHPEKNKKK